MDRRSNKCSSVFDIKALIKEKEEHLSAGGPAPESCSAGPYVPMTCFPACPTPSSPTTSIHSTRDIFPSHPSSGRTSRFWQLPKAFSQLLRERLRSRRARKHPAAVSSIGVDAGWKMLLPIQRCCTRTPPRGLLQAERCPNPAYQMGSTNIPAHSGMTAGFFVS